MKLSSRLIVGLLVSLAGLGLTIVQDASAQQWSLEVVALEARLSAVSAYVGGYWISTGRMDVTLADARSLGVETVSTVYDARASVGEIMWPVHIDCELFRMMGIPPMDVLFRGVVRSGEAAEELYIVDCWAGTFPAEGGEPVFCCQSKPNPDDWDPQPPHPWDFRVNLNPSPGEVLTLTAEFGFNPEGFATYGRQFFLQDFATARDEALLAAPDFAQRGRLPEDLGDRFLALCDAERAPAPAQTVLFYWPAQDTIVQAELTGTFTIQFVAK